MILMYYNKYQKYLLHSNYVLINQFVLKCTHDSGGVIICKDKNEFDFDLAKRKLNRNLKNNFYLGVQFHPEFKSRPNKPHPIFRKFIESALAVSR